MDNQKGDNTKMWYTLKSLVKTKMKSLVPDEIIKLYSWTEL